MAVVSAHNERLEVSEADATHRMEKAEQSERELSGVYTAALRWWKTQTAGVSRILKCWMVWVQYEISLRTKMAKVISRLKMVAAATALAAWADWADDRITTRRKLTKVAGRLQMMAAASALGAL